MSQDFNLNLPTLWFTQTPPAFPVPSMLAHGPSKSTYTTTWTQGPHPPHTTHITLICAVRFTNTLSTTKVRLQWQSHDPLHTVRAQQIHIPPPRALSAEELRRAHDAYGENLAMWVEDAVGTRVGDGECWSLVQRALVDLAGTYRRYGKEPPMMSQGRVHGALLLVLEASDVPGSNSGLLQLADVRRGDVVEMSSAHFHIVTAPPPVPVPASGAAERGAGMWMPGPSEKNVRMAHHTAVVVGVNGDVVAVVEQNGGVVGGAGREVYGLGDWVAGEMRFFRVVGEGLEEGWEEGG